MFHDGGGGSSGGGGRGGGDGGGGGGDSDHGTRSVCGKSWDEPLLTDSSIFMFVEKA